MQTRFKMLATALVAIAALPSLSHAALLISNKPTRNVSCTYAQCSATAPKAILNAGDLNALLAQYSSVYIHDYAVLGIVVKAPVSWTNTSGLNLIANGTVTIDGPMTVAGQGSVLIDSRALKFSGNGSIDFWSSSSSLKINDQSYILAGDIATLASNIRKNPSGKFALAKDYDATPDGPYDRPPVYDLKGVVDGLGHKISNFTFLFDDTYGAVGFFDTIEGTVRDFGLTHTHTEFEGTDLPVTEFGVLARGNSGLIQNVYTSGRLDMFKAEKGTDDGAFLGGLVGANSGTIEGSRSDVDLGIAGTDFQLLGGLAGINGGTILKSYTAGKIHAVVPSTVGGIAGANWGIIKDSYSLSLVNGDGAGNEGGLAGTSRGRIIASYAAGKAKKVSSTTGGIVGTDTTGRGLSDCFWDLDDGVSDPAAAVGNTPNYPGGTGLTTAQLQSGLPDGFDPKIWAENPAINNGLPYLISNPPEK